ncbi:MAG: GAF domain-containing protein [Candidatus Sulfotelmatobacter sp.]
MSSEKNNASGAKRSTTDPLNDLRLGAARKRLAESRNEEDAIEGLREIVANLLGCEEIGLFRVDRRAATVQLCWSFGVDLENYDLLQALGNAGLQRVMGGECHIDLPNINLSNVDLPGRDRFGATAKAQAFVPIRVANQTIAILAILRLLPQKLAFDRADMELFKLLSDEAAKPLFGPGAHSTPATEGPGMMA